MKIVTAREMKGIDRTAIEEYGIPSLVLMERAGLAVALKVREFYAPRKVIVLCGSGNNGGDGLVAARDLHNAGFRVKAFLLSEEGRLSPDCTLQYQIARRFGFPVEFRPPVKREDFHSAIVVDAVFGTGLSRPVDDAVAQVFRLVKDSEAPVVSVDIPSGVSSDTGEILGEAIRAHCTVTFGLPKRGHYVYPGAAYTGRLFVEDIGFPQKLLTSDALKVELVDEGLAAALIPPRPKYSHKGDYGHILLVAGSRGKTGAALLAAKACLRAGAGLVTIGVPESLTDIFMNRVTDEMTLPLPDNGRGALSSKAIPQIVEFSSQRADIIAIGSGIGVSHDTEEILSELLRTSEIPVVIDADGLNSLKGNLDLLKKAKSPLILTPHPGEMARLLQGRKCTIQDIEKDRITTALGFSADTGSTLVLKGVPTISATPEGRAFVNTSGNPGMATAGSGDVLTGIIASFLGQGLSPEHASILGVYLHGLAGDEAAAAKGEHGLIASDIVSFLPEALRILGKKSGNPPENA